jgi:hypothetical protein
MQIAPGAMIVAKRPDFFLQRTTVPWVHSQVLNEVENLNKAIACEECINIEPAYKRANFCFLYADYQEDPLSNYWKLVTLACLQCGFSEIHNCTSPDQRKSRDKEPNPFVEWEMKQKLQADAMTASSINANRQQAKMAAMASQYGMGQGLAGAQGDMYSAMANRMQQSIDTEILKTMQNRASILSPLKTPDIELDIKAPTDANLLKRLLKYSK